MAQQSEFQPSNVTTLNSPNHTKGDIMKSKHQEEENMEHGMYTKTEIDLKLEKINSDVEHGFEKIDLKIDQLKQEMRSGFEKVDLKFDNFEKRVETMLLTQENKRLEEQAKSKKEFMYWFIGLLVSTLLGILAIIVTILTTK
ncbi:hypothetical protein NMM18_05065 [Streptococcus oralis]|uniref:hypothetical protein n=1 Tax=Streptococcus oralis TaxID=1303 RepID=UPI0020C8B89F|nr:hypothetical protein [Streptococcus oralis]MCP9037459.1 hypothetical protein [Streptococcus oralis]MCP9052914.1 hypothetical protein [Streptococcus oralis]MCP9057945.1 hypothetical protein [Streptococcus oralis]MCP9065178.1 hypothetical protein [Streptococcus oralis]MCP9069739.1 hypothetical protein [Streptococcus oralis]